MKFIADTHIHSLASNHAYSTVMENIAAAKERGLLYMAMTEHGPKMPDAPHIWHIISQWEVPSQYNGVNILHGVEADIMDENGTLDIDDKTLKSLEWVIASMHTPCIKPSTVESHTKTWLNIAKNPLVDVIGHCGDGRYAFDYESVIKVFKEYGKIVEIDNGSFNCRPGVEKNCAEIAKLCKKYEVPVVVDSDAHFAGNIGKFPHAVKMLEEIDFPEKLVINANLELFEQIVAQKRADLVL